MGNLPASSTKTINDLVPYVIDALQGRTDVSTIAPRYIKRAIQEVCESNPFEELKITGPQVSLTVGVPTYPVTFFMADKGDDYVQIPSFLIFVDFPGNTVISTLQYKTVMALDPMTGSATKGLPSRWSRYGANIVLGPNPQLTYTVFMRYQKRHNFPNDESQLGAVQISIPDTWEEIVAYAAAERIAIVKRWNDQAQFLHDILYGDPESRTSQGKMGRPGLIQARLLQIERDQQHSSRQLMPLVPRYCNH
jgi:hypothetical protein